MGGLAEGRKHFLLLAEERPMADSMAQASKNAALVPGSLQSDSVGL